MEEVKKATAKVVAKAAPAAKAAEEKKPEVKAAAPVKEAEVKKAAPAAKAEKKAPAKKAPAKKTAEKKAVPAAKTAEKKAPVKKAAKVEETVNFQFSGKSYTPDDLMKIFKDVWKYDMNGREEDIKNVELYVKPEENTTYYVINGNVTGSFFI